MIFNKVLHRVKNSNFILKIFEFILLNLFCSYKQKIELLIYQINKAFTKLKLIYLFSHLFFSLNQLLI